MHLHYTALATDYDGTIADDGAVAAPTIAALERLRSAGCKLILVTGRELEDLSRCTPRLDLFDRVVAENGAVLYRPATREVRMLAEPPPAAFVARLREMGVDPLSIGRSVVATEVPNDIAVQAAIHELGLAHRIVLNKGSVMALPAGISKESGLRAALAELRISPIETVAIGDAENDLSFLNLCGITVAVANALPVLKQQADFVTRARSGAGVAELTERWLAGDLAPFARPHAGAAKPATSLMRLETLESAAAVRRCLAQREAFAALGARLRALDPPFVVVCARGSSAHAGTFLRVLLAHRLGLTAAAAMPSVASVYHRPQRLRGALFVTISQSGRSPDLIASAEQARAAGALTLALVNDPASPLASACELVLDIAAGPERSIAATKTVLASLAAALALVDAWRPAPSVATALAALPERLAAAAALDWSPLVETLADADRIFAVGRGPALGIVDEAALKLSEVCGIAGLAFSAAELAHGPMALAGPGFPVLALLQNDASLPLSEKFLATLAARGAPVLAAGGAVAGARALPVLAPMQPEVDLLPMLVSFYLAAEAAAQARGLNPDHPPSLHKVTQTI